MVWKPFIITAGDKNYRLMASGQVIEEECNHEEADTRLVYLAFQGKSDMVVVSMDTDVLVHDGTNWYMMYEQGKYANIGMISRHFERDICLALPAFHSLTGCDTTSYFFRVGKCRAFKKLMKQTSKVQLLNSLGVKKQLLDSDLENIKEFIRTVLYSGKIGESYIKTRVRLYENLKVKSSMPLPPDPLSVIQVVKRSHFQAYIWYNSDVAVIEKLELEDNGWSIVDDKIEPLWFVGSQLPPSTKHTKKVDTSIPQDGNDADIDTENEIPRLKRRCTRKRKKDAGASGLLDVVQGLPEPKDICFKELSANDAGIDGDIELDEDIDAESTTDANNQETDDESDWEVSDFMSSDDSCDEWMP